MKLKTSELFCASPASTAICTTMNHHAMVRRGSTTTTPRPINHRHHHHHNYYNNHYQFDFEDKPKFKTPAIPCTSQQHIDPKPYTSYLQKNRKSTSSITGKNGDFPVRRKSSAELTDGNNIIIRGGGGGGSSRYLLNNPVFVADLRNSDGGCDAGAMVVSEQVWPEEHGELQVVGKSSPSLLSLSRRSSGDSPRLGVGRLSASRRSSGGDSPAVGGSRSSSVRLHAPVESPGSKALRSRSCNQVVELRVSIHCKGCEGKVRKHISRMEGVKSFHIDLESKKVTVVGDVTPSSVLSSISKVKNAQLWPTTPSSSSSPFISIGY